MSFMDTCFSSGISKVRHRLVGLPGYKTATTYEIPEEKNVSIKKKRFFLGDFIGCSGFGGERGRREGEWPTDEAI